MITKTVLASEYAVLDSNVRTGGGTDDTAALQALLDKAAEYGGLRVIMDGAALVSGLRVHSNTTIECLNKDCGFFLISGTNKPVIENYDRDFEFIRNRNITLLGGTYNHNGPGQEHHVPYGDPAYLKYSKKISDPTEMWIVAMVFTGVENLLLRDVTICDQRTFATCTTNFKHVVMENIIIDMPNKTDCQNQDGLHFEGPGQFLTLRNITGDSGDDFIALVPDGPDKVSDMTDVLIDGVFLDHADQGIRLLSLAKGRLDRVTIRNISGTYRSFGFYLDSWFNDCLCGNFGDILFENVDLRPEAPNYDYRPPILFHIGGHFEHITFRNIRDHHTDSQRVLFEVSSEFPDRDQVRALTFVDELTIDGLSILRKDAFAISPICVDAAVERMILRNLDISCGEDNDVDLIAFGQDGRVGTLAVNGLISKGLKKLATIPDGKLEHKILWNIEPADLGNI